MKDYLFKYAPVALLAVGVGIWLAAFLLINEIGYKMILILCMLCQLLLLLCSGLIIKRLFLQAHSDSLTGAFNRRVFFAKVPAFLVSKLPVSLIMIDVDNFKRINDSYGHSAGDEVLKQLVEILKNHTRSTDIIIRMGGEEFAIVMPQTDDENVMKVAERMKRIIETKVFLFDSVNESVTVSIGIATTKLPVNADCILKYADKALYKAKETKNTIVVYQ